MIPDVLSGEKRTPFGERLDLLLDKHEAASIAKAMGLKDTSALSHYVAGRRKPDLAKLTSLARFAKVSADYLLGLDQAERPATPARGEDWHQLPKIAFTAAGEPVERLPADAVWYAFHRSWASKNFGRASLEDEQRLIVVQVEKKHLGESMLPTIKPGAVLVVDRGPGGRGIAETREIKQGAIYLVNPGEGLTVKRVFVSEGILTLASDNPDQKSYPPRPIPLKGKELQRLVVGRVRWIGHEEE